MDPHPEISSSPPGCNVQQWNKNLLIRENLPVWALCPLGVQVYSLKTGMTPHLVTAVLSLALQKNLSQRWQCLGSEKWSILADLHSRNPTERRAAQLSSVTGIKDPQATCMCRARQRQCCSDTTLRRYSLGKKKQPSCSKVHLHEGHHRTEDCEETHEPKQKELLLLTVPGRVNSEAGMTKSAFGEDLTVVWK